MRVVRVKCRRLVEIKSPWKIPLLMFMLSDIKVPLSFVRVNCAFQFFILCFKNQLLWKILLKILKISGSIHEEHYQMLFCNQSMHNSNFVSFSCSSQVSLLMISWSLQPYTPRLNPFCSSGKRSFCSRCEYVLSVRTDARSL